VHKEGLCFSCSKEYLGTQMKVTIVERMGAAKGSQASGRARKRPSTTLFEAARRARWAGSGSGKSPHPPAPAPRQGLVFRAVAAEAEAGEGDEGARAAAIGGPAEHAESTDKGKRRTPNAVRNAVGFAVDARGRAAAGGTNKNFWLARPL
jgi:hypothetical protein